MKNMRFWKSILTFILHQPQGGHNQFSSILGKGGRRSEGAGEKESMPSELLLEKRGIYHKPGAYKELGVKRNNSKKTNFPHFETITLTTDTTFSINLLPFLTSQSLLVSFLRRTFTSVLTAQQVTEVGGQVTLIFLLLGQLSDWGAQQQELPTPIQKRTHPSETL